MNIYIRIISLPYTVKGVTVQDDNGDYNVYVNNLLGEEVQKRAWEHEVRHIKLNHFGDFNPVVQNEMEASY